MTTRPPSWRTWASWAGLAAVLIAAVVIGSTGRSAPQTLTQRTNAIASEIRCPSCEDINAAESNSQAAVAVRSLIRQDLARGQTKAQIESYLVGRYGPDIILKPPARGVTAVVWFLPAAAALIGLVGALLALRRWRGIRGGEGGPDAADRAIVRAAMEHADDGD
ncbi:MAG TPA: cytochrome c-type biogenesis protein [Acidimicrobiales bacterium]|nr:cytochrome c-type biogenesis protein [Acidimicrobiales bacterium]